jgi:hypothetical protein
VELRVKRRIHHTRRGPGSGCERAVYKGGVGADKNTLSQGSAVDRADARSWQIADGGATRKAAARGRVHFVVEP